MLAPDSMFRAKCPECGYIPSPTLGALFHHYVQQHPEVRVPSRTCFKVSPIDIQKHFQNHSNVLAKQISKCINAQTNPAPVFRDLRRQALLSKPIPWHGPWAHEPFSCPQVHKPRPGPHLYRPSSDPQQGHTWPLILPWDTCMDPLLNGQERGITLLLVTGQGDHLDLGGGTSKTVDRLRRVI